MGDTWLGCVGICLNNSIVCVVRRMPYKKINRCKSKTDVTLGEFAAILAASEKLPVENN